MLTSRERGVNQVLRCCRHSQYKLNLIRWRLRKGKSSHPTFNNNVLVKNVHGVEKHLLITSFDLRPYDQPQPLWIVNKWTISRVYRTQRSAEADQLLTVGAVRRTKSKRLTVDKETDTPGTTMRELLTAVTKVLSSAYCILTVAIYVVIVVNRFTHFTPENHHDVEVGREWGKAGWSWSTYIKILSALLSVYLPDVGVQRVPAVRPGVPHTASQGSPEQQVSWQCLSQAGGGHLWSRLPSVLHLQSDGLISTLYYISTCYPDNNTGRFLQHKVLRGGRNHQDCQRDFDNMFVYSAGIMIMIFAQHQHCQASILDCHYCHLPQTQPGSWNRSSSLWLDASGCYKCRHLD